VITFGHARSGGQTVRAGAHQPPPARVWMPICGPACATPSIPANAKAAQITTFVLTASQCCLTLTLMSWRRATLIVAGLAGIFASLAGCASVKSTAVYYRSIQDYPAKPPDAPIPILSAPPDRPYKVIGRLAFTSDEGWNFLRKSMIYNARIHGADAVLLRSAKTRREVSVHYAPPKVDWYPASRRVNHGKIQRALVPYVRPGYPVRWVREITAIDAEMIVFKK
jgi:hypothetical protein